MLVIVSDLHLTDGSSGETIQAGAFRGFRESLEEMARDASWRKDGTYLPVKTIDLVLLGDVFDLLRSTQWPEGRIKLDGSEDRSAHRSLGMTCDAVSAAGLITPPQACFLTRPQNMILTRSRIMIF